MQIKQLTEERDALKAMCNEHLNANTIHPIVSKPKIESTAEKIKAILCDIRGSIVIRLMDNIIKMKLLLE